MLIQELSQFLLLLFSSSWFVQFFFYQSAEVAFRKSAFLHLVVGVRERERERREKRGERERERKKRRERRRERERKRREGGGERKREGCKGGIDRREQERGSERQKCVHEEENSEHTARTRLG